MIRLHKYLSNMVIIFSLMIYIFFIKLNFFPYYAILPYLFLGLGVFSLYLLKGKLELKFGYYFLFFLLLSFWSFFSFSFNVNVDLFYLKEVIVIGLIYFFSAFGIKYIFQILGQEYNVKNVLFFCIVAWILNIFISTIANINIGVFNVITSIINLDGLSQDSLSNFQEARFVGMGATFFGFGIVNSFFLILLSYYIVNFVDRSKYFLWVFVYLLIAGVGLLFSRTTILGIGLSLVLMILNLKKTSIIPIISLYLFVAFLMLMTFKDSLSDKLMFAFEMFLNFEDSQAAQSTGVLQDMWTVIPTSIETWLIGDSKYKYLDDFGKFAGYYMRTDVGYIRIIFANGLIGLGLLLSYFFWILKESFESIVLVLLLFLCFLMLNVKGVAMPYAFLFLFFIIDKK